jgi:hypothetical protein
MAPNFQNDVRKNYINGSTYDGPSSWMLRLASHWPISMLRSRDFSWTTPAQNPPANASLEELKLLSA